MAACALSSAPTSRVRRVAGRAAAVLAVVAVTMLGNLRLQASEAPYVTQPPVATTPVADHGTARLHGVAQDPMLDEDEASAQDEAVELVPAIYAWDPDVRFVYFRHVSKWM